MKQILCFINLVLFVGNDQLQLNTPSHRISINKFLETNGLNDYYTNGFGGDGPINPNINS